jgi:D-threo-aldose 1-dehydrogenase
MQLPRFGMGCSALGNLYRPMDDADATATVGQALDRGIAYFDVAPHYGFGLAEHRLGRALRNFGAEDLTISTKVGRILIPTSDTRPRHGFVDADPFEPVFDYSHDAILSSHEASLRRLGLNRVDLLLAHDLGTATHGDEADRHTAIFLKGGYIAMRRLKSEGRVSAIGIGVNEIAICERLLDEVALDVILLAGRYTLLEQGALPLLDRCAALGVQVIVGGPFNSGLLVETSGPRHYNYEAAPPEILERVERLASLCAAHRIDLPAAALAFPLAHPAVACVLPGFASPAQVDQFAAWRNQAIPRSLWSGLRTAGLVEPKAPMPGLR